MAAAIANAIVDHVDNVAKGLIQKNRLNMLNIFEKAKNEKLRQENMIKDMALDFVKLAD